jgi:hypothetical protein
MVKYNNYMKYKESENNIQISTMKTAHISFYKVFEFWMILATIVISVACLYFSISWGNKNLSDYDAIARLNIARKVTDSLTPGVAQLGGIWLPFPQVLFMPFTWNDFLWHSGLAGAFSSMVAFILSAYYLFKTVHIITGRKLGGFLAWLIFVTNVNLLLLQTMAMSESFFLFTLIMIIFHLTKWAKTKEILELLYAGIFVILATLTRYEGYALFGAATVSVAVVVLMTYGKNFKRLEGTLVLFMTLAGFGIFLWSLYSFLIFKDPIYWLNLYSGNKSIFGLDTQVVTTTTQIGGDIAKKISLVDAVRVYGSAMLYMNGIIIGLVALATFVGLLVKSCIDLIKKRANILILPTLIVAVCVFVFLIVGYTKHLIPNIETPYLNLTTILNKQRNFGSSSNIRYGLIITPLIALLIGSAFARSKVLALSVVAIVAFQLYAIVATPFFLTFSLPTKVTYTEFLSTKWFRSHYDGGLILTSANRHENFMFQTRLPYKNFIYEGSQEYWKKSIKDPSTYATWVVLDDSIRGDAVNELMTDKSILVDKFTIVYREGGLKIFKRKPTN